MMTLMTTLTPNFPKHYNYQKNRNFINTLKHENCKGDLSGDLWSVPEAVRGQDGADAATEVPDLINQIF